MGLLPQDNRKHGGMPSLLGLSGLALLLCGCASRPIPTTFNPTLVIAFFLFAFVQTVLIVVLAVNIRRRILVEQQLKKQQDELKTIFDSVPAMIYYKNTRNNLIRVNLPFASALGLRREEIEGKSSFDLLADQEIAQKYWQDDQEVITTGQPKWNIVEPLVTDNSRWGRTDKIPYYDAAGNIIGVIGFSVDITQNKVSEEALRRSEEKSRALFKNFPEPLYLWQLAGEELVLVDYNNVAKNITNGEVVKTLGHSMREIYRDNPEIQEDFLRCLSNHVVVSAERCHAHWSAGELRVFRAEYIFVPPDQVVLHTDDISTNDKIYRDLQESDERLRGIFDHSYDGIILTDAQGVILAWNHACEALFGISAGDVLGKPIWEEQYKLTPEERRSPEHLEYLKTTFLQNAEQEIQKNEFQQIQEASYRHPNGEMRFIQQISFPIPSAQGYLIGISIRDITFQKNAERKLMDLQTLMDVGSLMAGVAHEVKSPLQVITMISESLMERLSKYDPDLPASVQDLQVLNRNAWRISEIMRSLLRYTHQNSEGRALHNLNEIVADVLLLIGHQLSHWRNIRVTTNLDEHMPDMLCERNKLTQVIINLLTNARDAMSQGGEITIRTVYDAETDSLLLEVSDTGEGISDEIREHIFEPFFTTKPGSLGMGLGMPIVMGILHDYGGEMQIDSQPGAGATFRLFFPLQPGAEEEMERTA